MSEIKSVTAKNTLAKAKVTAALDIEGNVPLESVQLDGLVVLKIIKHCHEFFPNPVTGQLLGLDVDRVLEVTNSFPFPGASDEHELIDSAKYQVEMMRCLHDVNIDHNTVGWYQSTYLGSFITHKLIDTQFTYQQTFNNKSVVIVHDVSRSINGNLALSAYRFTQAFIEARKEGKFTSESLAKNKLTFSNIFEELPITIKNSHLVTAFLHSLDDFENVIPKTSFPISIDKESVVGPLTPNFETLELSLDPYIEKNLEFLLKSIEDNNHEQNNFAFWQKNLAKAQSALQKRKQENEARKESGLEPLPEDDILKMYKIPPEPSRLESLLITSQINGYCKQLNQYAGPTLSKLFVARELQK